MPAHFIVSVLCDDRPGIVKTIAEVVGQHDGNWLASRLAQLDGKFAGVIRVSVPGDHEQSLCEALAALAGQGIMVRAQALAAGAQATSKRLASFSLSGPDRAGIVRELSRAFAQYNINVEELETRCSSMPYSGDPLFEAEGLVRIPEGDGLDPLLAQLNAIADELALDIRLEESS